MAAVDPSDLEIQKYPRVATGQIADPTDLPVVKPLPSSPAGAAGRFFERR
jgi:hypothetical protein